MRVAGRDRRDRLADGARPAAHLGGCTAAKHALRGLLTSPLFAHATSATGRTPRVPPDASRPEVVAQALAEAAVAPRAEVVLGGETKLMDLLDGFARPVSNLL